MFIGVKSTDLKGQFCILIFVILTWFCALTILKLLFYYLKVTVTFGSNGNWLAIQQNLFIVLVKKMVSHKVEVSFTLKSWENLWFYHGWPWIILL